MDLRLVRHGVVDSTNERAFAELAAGGACHGDLHVAAGQTKGRGRLGRRWESEPGAGLYASLVLLPRAPWSAPALTMALGLAVLDAVRALGLARARLDWPNDVVVGGAKLAGILVETRDLDPARPAYVAGVGLNVRQREFPAELLAERAVTSLAIEGIECDVEDALAALVRTFPPWIEALAADLGPIERAWAAAAGLESGRVRAELARGVVEGRLEHLSVARGIAIAQSDGSLVRAPLEHVRGLAPIE